MKNSFAIFFLLFTPLLFAQSNSPIYLTGSIDDISMNAVFSPDGNKIAYTKAGYKGIWIYDLNTNSSKQITDEIAAGFAFKWSSDSKSILTRVAKYEDLKRYNAVKVFNIDLEVSSQLTDYKTMMPFLPEWTDGDSKVLLPTKDNFEIYLSGKPKLQYRNNNEKSFFLKDDKIFAENVNTNKLDFFEPIKDAQYINFSLSPDRTKIVLEVMGGNIFVMNVDGTNLTDLGKGNRPRWSSDSRKLIYMITEDDGQDYTASDIYTINTDGTQKINITNTKNRIEMNPCISPDGKKIVFDVYNDGSVYLMNIE